MLGGAEIARSESMRDGSIPLHTLRADIDYATSEALTTYGLIGVKVWVFKGEILSRQEQTAAVSDATLDEQVANTLAGRKHLVGEIRIAGGQLDDETLHRLRIAGYIVRVLLVKRVMGEHQRQVHCSR